MARKVDILGMKKFILLVLSLSLTAASCNLLGGSSGAMGILKSDDGAKNFQVFNTINQKGNINGVSVNVLAFDAKNPEVIYLGSAGGIFKTVDGAKTWVHILTGITVSDISTDPNSSDVLYAAGLAGRNGKIIRSADGGNSWTDVYTEPSKSNAVASIAVSKANSKIVLAGLSTGEIIRSVDEGKTWQVATDLEDVFVKIRFYNSFTVYALTLSKGLVKSTDQGATWNPLPTGQVQLPAQSSSGVRRFLDLAFDQKLAGVIFVATDQGLLRTIDDGITWGLMYLPVRNTTLQVTAAAVNPTDSNNILTAVGSTMFKSTNGGVTWETIKLPSGQTVRHILMNPSTPNIIYLGMGDRK